MKARLAKRKKVRLAKTRMKVRLAKTRIKVRLAKARMKARLAQQMKARLAKARMKARLARARMKARLAEKRRKYRDATWERPFAELSAYRRRRGHCHLPSRSQKYRSLGHWVNYQRVLMRSGRLSAERKQRLEQIGFDWVARGRSVEFRDSTYWNSKWDRMLAKLARFKRRFGHCFVPTGWQGNPRLGPWVSRQRQLKQRGLLSKERQRKLEALGFDWRTNDSAGPRWERCLVKLIEFRRRFGHVHVPAEWKEDLNLGRWVVKTRRLRKAGRLSAYKIRRLHQIGFVWDPIRKRQGEHDALWSEWLAHLIEFHQKYGHWRVPTEQPKFHSLRVWMDNQRISYKRGWLQADRIQQLDKLGFPWLSVRAQELAAKARAGNGPPALKE